MSEKVICCVAWHNPAQKKVFCEQWNIREDDPRVHFQQDVNHSGCAATKNKAIMWAMEHGYDVVCVIDDDCYCVEGHTFEEFIKAHVLALNSVPVEMFKSVTNPPSRGTPYLNRSITMPVAASVGFWENIPDLDACSQLAHGLGVKLEFDKRPIFGQMFAMSGMNIAFRPRVWWPYCKFVEIDRMDDIFCGVMWQKRAYSLGYCFNLNGPMVYHSRQSNVWNNLRSETKYLEQNETFWSNVYNCQSTEYHDLCKLIPKPK